MDINDYEKLLSKAEPVLSGSNKNQERLQIPEPDIIYEGKVTIIRNFMDMVDLINRDPKHISKFLMTEFGIGVNISGKRLIINRKISADQINTKIRQYMDSFVICYECNSPDTDIQKIGRTNVLVCKACGAQHPIRIASETAHEDEKIEEGKMYTVQISRIGASGEGRAFYRGYNIFVPGVKKGDVVKVNIKKIRNNTAIAEVVDRSA